MPTHAPQVAQGGAAAPAHDANEPLRGRHESPAPDADALLGDEPLATSALRQRQAMANRSPRARGLAQLRARLAARPVVQREPGIEVGAKVQVRIPDDAEHMLAPDLYVGTVKAVSDTGYVVQTELGDFPFDEAWVVRSKGISFKQAYKTVGPVWEREELGFSAEVQKKVSDIAGDAPLVTELSEEQLERMIVVIEETRPTGDTAAASLLKTLKTDLEEVRAHSETPEQFEARAARLKGETKALEDTAFASRFGTTPEEAHWGSLSRRVSAWYAELKSDESRLTFKTAFTANRMTARQINTGTTARGGGFQVPKYGRVADPGTDRTMYLDRSIGGIGGRTSPEKVKDRSTVNEEGLHDLSASLLRGDNDSGIYEQLKRYEDAVVLFMPLPEERDLRILSALARVKGMDFDVIASLQALITRPVLAQASDMGTTFVDASRDEGSPPAFRYGLTGTVIRQKGDRARKINRADMAAREKGALSYKSVVTAEITRVNEVVMAYRQSESKIFPMYAQWDKKAKHFVVVTAGLTPTGATLSNKGDYTA